MRGSSCYLPILKVLGITSCRAPDRPVYVAEA
jgi:hypothetical protein